MELKIINEFSKNEEVSENSHYLTMARRIIKKSDLSPDRIIAKFLEMKINIPEKPGDGSFIDGSKNKITLQLEIPKSKLNSLL